MQAQQLSKLTPVRVSAAVKLAFLFLTVSLSVDALQPRVLFINSYHPGYEWSDDETRGVLQALKDSKLDPFIFIEYADTQRHNGDSFQRAFFSLLLEKYNNLKPDVIVTSDDDATLYALRLRDELKWQTPILFCGVNDWNGDSWVRRVPQINGGIAGVLEIIPIVETAIIANKLSAGTKEMVVVNYGIPEIRYDLRIEKHLPGIKVRLLPTAKFSRDGLRHELEKLKAGTIVIAAPFSKDLTDNFVTAERSIRFVVEHSSVPVYGISKNSLGLGIIGGKLNDGYYHGLKAGNMAAMVLRGEVPAQLGVSADSGQPFQFDFNQLRRWAIKEDLLPPGSLIVNKPLSVYEIHKETIGTVVAFVSAQSIAIVLLLILRARRRRAELALGKSEQRFRATFEQSAIGMAQISLQGKCLMVNERLCDNLGYARQELADKNLLEFSCREDSDLSEATVAPNFESGEIPTASEQRFRHKSGHIIWMYQCVSLVRSSQGNPEYYLFALEDISERKMAEQQLLRSNGVLRQFAYAAAHELQEPLRNVALCSEMLSIELGRQERTSVDWLIRESASGAQRMQRMVKDLLAFSKATEAISEDDAIADSQEALAAALSNLENEILRAHAQINCGPLPQVAAHEAQVMHVFQNLISNAVKYHEKDRAPAISITAKRAGAYWLFEVSDNGIGFDPEHAKRIFGLFKRLHGSEYPGSGIGLAISARIVEYYGGSIWADGEPGKGATFYFTLPRVKNANDTLTAAKSSDVSRGPAQASKKF